MTAMPLELAPCLFTLGAAAVRMVRPVHSNALLCGLYYMSGISPHKASASCCKMGFSKTLDVVCTSLMLTALHSSKDHSLASRT